MPDREKVIKGLKCCSVPEGHCEECQYKTSGYVAECTSALARDALVLLKEQEAVEPIAIKQEMFYEFYGAVACCPKCDCLWIMYMDNDMHYCPECGQAVKWDA